MNADRIVKLVVVAAIVFVAWKYVVPWIKEEGGGGKTSVTSSDNMCVRGAERASETWGSGLRQFVNPPYDLNAWSSFRGNVESRISDAESACSCSAESCTKVREAMRDLRSLVADLDSTIRNGSEPSGFVERQGAIDDKINEAAELARAGK